MFRDDFYQDYCIDPFQVTAIEEVLDNICDREAHAVLVLLPLSADLRKILGNDNLNRFISVTREIAEKLDVPLLDYLSSYSGEEYEYYDGSHLNPESQCLFTKRLALDLRNLSEESGFPNLDTTTPLGPEALQAEPPTVSVSKETKVTFTLNGSPFFAERKYILLGSLSGKFPGIHFNGNPYVLPVNADAFTDLIFNSPQDGFFHNFSGKLDHEGRVTASMDIPDKFAGYLKGKTLWFAFAVIEPVEFTSNTVRLDFVD
ncbi:MAG: hypothetical protein KJ645_11520 [Planctomycetes bacterium]|nr:hypothetical protein [Planctomycetota bacterium]